MNLFEKEKRASNLFSHTEEESSSEKTKFVNTFQPTLANGVGAPPIPKRYIPIYFTPFGHARYIVMQRTRMDGATKNRQCV